MRDVRDNKCTCGDNAFNHNQWSIITDNYQNIKQFYGSKKESSKEEVSKESYKESSKEEGFKEEAIIVSFSIPLNKDSLTGVFVLYFKYYYRKETYA